MICNCCSSDNIRINPKGITGYSWCKKCKYLFANNRSNENISESIANHYQHEDPHKDVSDSKTTFYNFALRHLENKFRAGEKTILDIGCGYGYFLDLASQKKWKPFGIEIVPDAVNICREKFGYYNIFQGELTKAGLSDKFFNAITLWDVIAIVDNPYDELKECYRLLKKGGIIGIRTRNAAFQITAYHLYGLVQKNALRFGLKKPYVFNQQCFSAESLNALLSRVGYINIKISNSILTSGNAYNHMPSPYPVEISKAIINIYSQLIYWMTNGQRLVAPSLMIWAEKP
jgi:SAM-dependent methyltransferase